MRLKNTFQFYNVSTAKKIQTHPKKVELHRRIFQLKKKLQGFVEKVYFFLMIIHLI